MAPVMIASPAMLHAREAVDAHCAGSQPRREGWAGCGRGRTVISAMVMTSFVSCLEEETFDQRERIGI